MNLKLIFLLTLLPLVTQAGMFGDSNNLAQNKTCPVSDAKQIGKKCHDGDVLIFTPQYFGNAQLPIKIVGFVCDFRHPIVYNKGGVTCIFTTKRKKSW